MAASCVVIRRYASSVSRKDMTNHFDYAKKAKAISSIILKHQTANERKKQFLTEYRTEVAGSMKQHAKYMKQLKDKSNQRNHKKSVAILRECEQDGVAPNIVLYSKLLDNCAKSFAPNMVSIKLIQEMITKYSIQPNCIIFASLLDVFFRNECYYDCLILFALSRTRIQFDIKTLLQPAAYQKSQEISYILHSRVLLNSIKQIECNVVCANIALKCIGKLGEMNKVTEFFQCMIQSDMLPNDVTLNSMLHIFASHQCIDKMEKLFNWWSQNTARLQVPIDIISINSMLTGYAKLGDTEKCEALFNKYCSKEHSETPQFAPTVITFSQIITSASRKMDQCEVNDHSARGKLRDFALKYYKKMQLIYGMDDYYNSSTTAVMNVCLKCGDLKSLLRIFDERKRKDPKDAPMYKIAVRALFEEGLIPEALNLFDEGVQNKALKYVSADKGAGAYSIDVHGHDTACAVLAVMHNIQTICENLAASSWFTVPTVWIIIGKATHGANSNSRIPLGDTLPKFLVDERLFSPPLLHYIPDWNTGLLRVKDEALLRYIAFQTKTDVEELRPRFMAFNCEQQSLPDLKAVNA